MRCFARQPPVSKFRNRLENLPKLTPEGVSDPLHEGDGRGMSAAEGAAEMPTVRTSGICKPLQSHAAPPHAGPNLVNVVTGGC